MRKDRIWEIAKKDMLTARRHRYVLYSLVALPLILSVLMPVVYIYPFLTSEIPPGELPPFAPGGIPYNQAMILAMVNMTLLLFMIIPAMIPSVIGSYTFVGEKVNRQLEPLLATPTTDSEVLTGKILGAFIPAMLVTVFSFICFTIVVNALTFQVFGYLVLPNIFSLLVLCVYCPLMALLSVSFCVFISSKVSDIRAAMQIGALPVVPLLGFFLMYIFGVITPEPLGLLIFAALLGLASAAVLMVSRATFRREEILTRWK